VIRVSVREQDAGSPDLELSQLHFDSAMMNGVIRTRIDHQSFLA